MNMSDQQQRIREGERMYGTVFNSSSDAVITALGRSAVEIAANAAADYLRNKKVTGRSGIDTQKLLDIIRAQVKSHLDEALNDA
jgi:carbamoylphosphate synthase small subunit